MNAIVSDYELFKVDKSALLCNSWILYYQDFMGNKFRIMMDFECQSAYCCSCAGLDAKSEPMDPGQ